MDIIEHVARVIDEASDYRAAYSDEWRKCARAAIRATIEHLRDNVSDGMVDAGVGSDHGKTLGSRVVNCHQAMLTQALAEIDAKPTSTELLPDCDKPQSCCMW